jgi:hypothetical protein
MFEFLMKGGKAYMANKNPHVVPRGDDWAVVREHGERASSLHGTQAEAIEAGRRIAQRDNLELFIHRPNGQIRDRDSYGKDPCPPRDKKH